MSEETEYDFKRTSAQIETLLDKIPAEGDVAKVYNTTLDIFGIQDGSVVTKEQNVEVSNIMDKWNQGYIVTYVDTRQSTFHYGVLNVCRCDDGVPTTLSVINDRGDLLAYSFEHVGEETWTVTNKTSGVGGSIGGVYQTTLDFSSIRNGNSVTEEESNEIQNMLTKFRAGYNIIYTIPNQDGFDLIPRGNILIGTSMDDYFINLAIIGENGEYIKSYNLEYGGVFGSDWKVKEIGGSPKTQELVYKSYDSNCYYYSWRGGSLESWFLNVPVRFSGYFTIMYEGGEYLFTPQFVRTITTNFNSAEGYVCSSISSSTTYSGFLSVLITLSSTSMSIRLMGAPVDPFKLTIDTPKPFSISTI